MALIYDELRDRRKLRPGPQRLHASAGRAAEPPDPYVRRGGRRAHADLTG